MVATHFIGQMGWAKKFSNSSRQLFLKQIWCKLMGSSVSQLPSMKNYNFQTQHLVYDNACRVSVGIPWRGGKNGKFVVGIDMGEASLEQNPFGHTQITFGFKKGTHFVVKTCCFLVNIQCSVPLFDVHACHPTSLSHIEGAANINLSFHWPRLQLFSCPRSSHFGPERAWRTKGLFSTTPPCKIVHVPAPQQTKNRRSDLPQTVSFSKRGREKCIECLIQLFLWVAFFPECYGPVPRRSNNCFSTPRQLVRCDRECQTILIHTINIACSTMALVQIGSVLHSFVHSTRTQPAIDRSICRCTMSNSCICSCVSSSEDKPSNAVGNAFV